MNAAYAQSAYGLRAAAIAYAAAFCAMPLVGHTRRYFIDGCGFKPHRALLRPFRAPHG